MSDLLLELYSEEIHPHYKKMQRVILVQILHRFLKRMILKKS